MTKGLGLMILVCVVAMGCDFLTQSPASNRERAVQGSPDADILAVDTSEEIEVVDDVDLDSSIEDGFVEDRPLSDVIKNEACEMVRTIVSGETSHSDFTRWIFGQPDLMGDALIADFFHNALRVYAKLHQSAIHPDETFNETFTANRNAMLEVLEIRCGLATNIGAQGLPPGCSMWDQYIVGAISSYQFESDYVAQIGTPTYWDDYNSELAFLSIIFRGANLGNDFTTANADLDWEIGALHTMIDEVCDPNSYRDQVDDQDLSIEDIPPELLPEGFENGG